MTHLQKQVKVSVIIPCRNHQFALNKTLRSLSAQTLPQDQFEVLVIDNASNPALDLSEFAGARCLVEMRAGSYAARNLGISQSQGDLLAFLDADCIAHECWLERGLNFYLKNLSKNNSPFTGPIRWTYKNERAPNAFEIYDSYSYLNQKKYVEEFHFAATANFFVPKIIFQNEGLFNAALKSGGDREFGRRLFSRGYKIAYVEGLVVAHPARGSFLENLKKTARVTRGVIQQCDTSGPLIKKWRILKSECLFHSKLHQQFVETLKESSMSRRVRYFASGVSFLMLALKMLLWAFSMLKSRQRLKVLF